MGETLGVGLSPYSFTGSHGFESRTRKVHEQIS